jgi:branched-chain amino acid transport system permease protein
MNAYLRKNLLPILTLVVIVVLFSTAAGGMTTQDFVITLLRGLSVGAITFLVASGLSLIFGLLDVLNLAHGTLFMVGAYIGWTVFVRPDTFVDLLTPVALALSGFALGELWAYLSIKLPSGVQVRRLMPWLLLVISVALFIVILPRYPVAMWNLENYAQSPISYSYMANQGTPLPPPTVTFSRILPGLAIGGLLIASLLAAFGISLFGGRAHAASHLKARSFFLFAVLLLVGLGGYFFNDALTNIMIKMNSGWLFLVAVLVATLSGAGLGALMEVSLIRPLYSRPIYQLMLTIGLSYIGVQIVQAVWGRPEFVMPKPAIFNGSGSGCPATSFAAWWQNQCSTILLLNGRVRVYNEIFIPLVGILVLIGVWILLKRTRLGMIIRAGVQDREMVEALGINVRRVFTFVFALGVGLAALGGALAAPSTGLSNAMGESLLLSVLVALAIGGLTSYPGAALGSLLVGLIQQFIIKYGQIGIPIPFTHIVFKPTPPIVPASTVLLMVIILLIMPGGLFGKKE